MSDLKILLTAEIDPSSIGNITKQIKGLQEGAGKIKIDIDTAEIMNRLTQLESKMKPMKLDINTEVASRHIKSIRSDIDKVTKISSKKIELIDTKGLERSTGIVKQAQSTLTSSMKQIEQSYKGMGDTSLVWTESANGIEKFTVKVRESDSVTKQYKYSLKELADGQKTWAQEGIRGAEDQIKGAKTLASEKSKLLTIERQLNAIDKNAGKLGASNPDKSKLLEQSSKLRDVQRQYLGDLNAVNKIKLSDLSNSVKSLGTQTSEANQNTKSFSQTMSGLFKRAAGWVSLTMAIRLFAREIKKGVAMVKEIDTAMVELKKVTNETDEAYVKFVDTAFKMGAALGRTGTEAISATADFARMGFEMDKAAGLAREALLMLNVGDGIENIDDATSAMIATLRGFGATGDESVATAGIINDAFNEVANNFAIDTGSIASSTKRISAVMNEAGNDVYQTTGLITGAFEVIQNSEKVSSGLNIITQRLQAVKKVGGQLVPTLAPAFDSIGMSILDQNNEMKSTYDILQELSAIYPTLTSQQQKYISEAMSGKRQSVVLKAIMSNWENVEAATESATNSLGSSAAENAVYLDSIEGKMQIFTSSMQEFWATAIETDTVKNFVDMGTSFVGTATAIMDSVGGLELVLLSLIPIIGIKFVSSMTLANKAVEGFEKMSLGQAFKTLIPGFKGTEVAAKGTAGGFNTLSIASFTLKAALFALPAIIMAIVSAEQRRKKATEDSINAYSKQKDISKTVGELADRYEQLSKSTEIAAKNSEELQSIKERLKKILPETSEALDNENLSFEEQAEAIREINKENRELAKNEALKAMAKSGDDIDSLNDKLKKHKTALESMNKGIETYQQKIDNGEKLSSEQMRSLDTYIEGQGKYKGKIEETTASIAIYNEVMGISDGVTGNITTKTELFAAILELRLAKAAGLSAGEIEKLEQNISNSKSNIEGYGTMAEDTASKISDFGSAADDATESIEELERTMTPEESYLSSYARDAAEAEKNIKLLTGVQDDLKDGNEIDVSTTNDLIKISKDFIGFRTMTKKEQQKVLSDNKEFLSQYIKDFDNESEAIKNGTSDQQQHWDAMAKSAEATGKMWNGLSFETKQPILDASGLTGFEENFNELLDEWLRTDPPEKEFLATMISLGLEESEDFQEKWDLLDPDVKKFIAEASGLDEVQEADAETMSQWAMTPEVLWFLAQEGGLENVRIEKDKTDDVWNVTIGEKTYKTNEEGAEAARKEFGLTNSDFAKIPLIQTRQFVIETVRRDINQKLSPGRNAIDDTLSKVKPVIRWTGDDSFKGGLSYVGEKGRELLVYPDGSHDMTGSKTELRNLPRGTKIYNNSDTEDILAGKMVPKFNDEETRKILASDTPKFNKGNAKGEKTPQFAKGNTKADEYKATADRYEGINISLEKYNTLLAKNKILQENAKDGSARKIQLLKEEIELEIKHKKLLNDKLNLSIRERNQQRDSLKKQGFKFKGSGHNEQITNLGNIKGKSQETEEIFNKYNELQFKTIPSIQTEIMQIASNMEKAVSDGFVQHTRNINHLVENAHYLEMNAIYQERANNDLSKKIELMKEEESIHERTAYLTRGQAKILRDERNVLEANLRKQGAIFEGSGDSRKIKEGTQNNLIQGKNKEVESQLNRWNELQFDLIPNITIDEMKLADTINNVKEKIHQASMQQLQDELDLNTKSQDDLRFKKEILSDDDLSGRLELTQKITEKEIERYGFIKSNVKELKEQLKTTKENSEEWHMINKSLDEYNQKLKDSTLELKRQKNEMVSIAQAQADKQYDADLISAGNSIFGGNSDKAGQAEKDAKEVLDKKIEAFEDYISGEEKALEIAQIRKMVEEESLVLTQEQQNILNQGGEVERAKLDRLNKQLNIQQLQAKLENQKNQKNIRQLVKKDDGTFDFEYVADKKAMKETENAILDSKKDLANWELKYALDKDRKIFEEKQKLLAVEEERLQARLKAEKEAIEAHYQAIMERQIVMMEMNMALMEQLNSEKSIGGWSDTLKEVMPMLDTLGISFADAMKELGISLESEFDVILPLLYDMGLLHEDMVEDMGIDFEKYMDAVVPVLDELGIDHKEFMTFMGVDLDKFLSDSKLSFSDYLANVRKKNLETKADVEATKDALRVPTESTHTVKLIAPPPFSMPDTSSTHTIHTVHTSSGGQSPSMAKFDTGGKTPAFSGGRVAMLHEKEIVLNKSQSATFEKLIDLMPNMVNTFNDIGNKFKGLSPKIPKVPTSTNNKHSEETNQHFHISKLEFPNVKDAKEIEGAILKLPMLAKQRVRPV